MRLRQIKLAGFKSFVDPTTVSFPGNRCAIVGPNGCGKSNIIDAVRWVMGESSARQLRGEQITDVIFNGSTSRRPTAVAAIDLLFDNSDGRVGGEYAAYSEIAIRRQVSRDAQSTYFLNGEKCRRRDVMDLFLGTGFGPRSYSIIEQGMISQIVEAKPEELRVYLEEAAGISKYKERRRETENRIRHTQENLDRLQDIRDELERQLEHLKRQARAAERYRELKEDERKLTAELYAIRLNALERELADRESAIRGFEVRLERSIAEQRAVDTAIEHGRQRHTEQSDEFNRVQGRFYQLGADIARIEEAIQYNQQRIKELEADLDATALRRDETERQLALDDDAIKQLRGGLNDIEPKVAGARAVDDASARALDAVERALDAWQATWERFNERAAANQRDADVAASQIQHHAELLERLSARRAQIAAELSIAASVDIAQDFGADIERLAAEFAGAERQLAERIAALASAREDATIREQVVEHARADVERLRNELASLEAVQRAALGRAGGAAEAWLSQAGLADAPRLGESLSVVAGWERAIETVLGDRLQTVRVKALVSHAKSLADLASGVVTLLDSSVEPSLADGQAHGRELPWLASFVFAQAPARTKAPLGSLLDGVRAASSLGDALAARGRLSRGESIVTRDGLWIGRDWIRLDRGDDVQHGVLARGQQIDDLRARAVNAEAHLTDLQGRLAEGRSRIATLDAEREALGGRVQALGQRLAEVRADHGVHRVRVEEADARRERAERERAEADAQIAEATTRLADARARASDAERGRIALEAERAEHAVARERNVAAVESARRTARADRDAFHELNVGKQALLTKLAATETGRDRLLDARRELETRRATLRDGIEASQAPLPNLQRDLEGRLADRLAVEHRLNDVRRGLEEVDAELRALDGERGEKAAAVDAIRSDLEAARVERQGQTVKRSTLIDQVKATGHALEDIRAQLPAEATEEDRIAELERVAARIQRLGPINLAAIEEYQSSAERKSYLDAQHADLTEALATLSNAIRKIDRETRQRFKDTFEAVNTRLGELFPKVFGGGHAYLELTGEDLLDTGVTLMARPPGKRNSSVHLLSGGEKAMTAVALIFAIFQLNPSPVCLLDEVDAPLDDSNVVRFANLIRDMSTDVQFIVITHNKLTMEMADQLLGVTMNEPGVSRLVSVDVEEAAKMAAV